MLDADANELLPIFVLEIQEHLESLDNTLLKLESEPRDPRLLDELFRVLHTIKGGCSLFGFNRLSRLVHHAENLAAALRSSQLSPYPELLSALFACGDTLRQRLDQIQALGKAPEEDDQALSDHLEALLTTPVPESVPVSVAEAPAEPVAASVPAPEPLISDDAIARRGEGLLHVDVQLLNRLLDRSAELLLLRHAFVRATPGGSRSGTMSARDYQQLCLRYQGLALELQESLLQVRMQPIGQLWKAYPRLLRELSQRTGKQLQLITVGEDTELDKSILEAIRDPLVHLLRNAVDHGFEPPAERQQQGKPAQGSLRLSAYQDEGSIFVTIEDDGRGLDLTAIRQRGLDQGLITPADAEVASEEALIELLFEPGFTTARTVTDLSGRGVGMDVVRTNLAQVGGTIEVHSRQGQGTRFTLRLPLTLTLLPALLLKQNGQQLALPQHHLKEILTRHQLEELSLGDRPFCRWRGQTLPLGDLGDLLGSGPAAAHFVVILQGQRRFALAIEDVSEIQDVAVKPLSAHWETYPLLAGASLLGSGQLAIVLSPAALEARICREDADNRTPQALTQTEELKTNSALLLCEAIGGGQLALPLAEVEALDDLSPEQLLNLPGNEIVSRRGEIVPVLDIGALLAGQLPVRSLTHPCSLVICEREGRRVGLLVAQVIDIVADQAVAQGPPLRPGISRTAMLAEGPVEVLDPQFIWSQLTGAKV